MVEAAQHLEAAVSVDAAEVLRADEGAVGDVAQVNHIEAAGAAGLDAGMGSSWRSAPYKVVSGIIPPAGPASRVTAATAVP